MELQIAPLQSLAIGLCYKSKTLGNITFVRLFITALLLMILNLNDLYKNTKPKMGKHEKEEYNHNLFCLKS